MKKIIFLLITIVCIYLIYYFFNKTSINYLVISDNVMLNTPSVSYNDYVYNYIKKKKNINEYNTSFINNSAFLLYQDIKNNRTIRSNNKDYYFKKSLRESDFVVISVGMEEMSINYNKYDMKSNYEYFKKMYINLENLIIEIKKYAQAQIVFLGFYNPTNYYDSKVDEFFYDINIKLNRLMVNNLITYIDLYELVKGNNYKDKNPLYLNNEGNKKIANSIIFYIE